MEIRIWGRERMRRYANKQHAEQTAVISIANIDEAFLDLHRKPSNGIDALCEVSFNDVELGINGAPYGCITDADADQIVAFVHEIAGKTDKLIIQCEDGVSRSAGVAAAIMAHFSDEKWHVWNHPNYRPNVTCYRKVMAAFHDVIDERELKANITENRYLIEFFADDKVLVPPLVLFDEDEEGGEDGDDPQI